MLIILVTGLGISEEKFFKYPDKPTDKWKKLTDEEQYKLFVEINKEYDLLFIKYNSLSKLYDKKVIELERNENYVNRNKFGFSLGSNIIIDNKLNVDLDIYLGFNIITKKYFLFQFYGVYKPFMNNGGGVGFSFGVIL